mgnify:CR=1 FL=1
MEKVKVVITGAGGGGANYIISTIIERVKYHLIGFDISPYKVARANVDSRFVAVSYTHLTLPTNREV